MTAIEPRMELEQHLHMYRQMAKIRAFEEQVHELYKSAKMPGLAHLYVGEEAVAVGVCEALRGVAPPATHDPEHADEENEREQEEEQAEEARARV